MFRPYKRSLAGDVLEKRRPKEQPPRKLSGKRTAKEMNFWKAGRPVGAFSPKG